MPTAFPLVRTFVDANGPIAEVCLIIQDHDSPARTWQWDLPYLLWVRWGTGRTTTWLCEQYRRHDARWFHQVGSQVLRVAIQRALQRHVYLGDSTWLSAVAP